MRATAQAQTPHTPAQQPWRLQAALFLAGQSLSLFGSSLVQFAILWHVTLQAGSGLMLTLCIVCSFAPQVVISLFAGVWADRYNRRALILLADGVIALATLALAVLYRTGRGSMGLLFVVACIRSAGAGVQSPAVNALAPQLVPRDKLMFINALNNTLQSAIMLLSPALSGALLSAAALETIFFVDVATAAPAIALLLALRVPARVAAARPAGYLADLRLGLRYARGSGFIGRLLVFMGCFYFCIVPAAMLTPLMIARTFGEEVWRLTASEVGFSAGAIVGGALITIWGGFNNRMVSLALAMMGFGLCSAALALAQPFAAFLAVMVITGLCMPLFSSAGSVLLQERVPQAMHGRVFSLLQIVATASTPLAMLLFGPLADLLSVQALLLVCGAVMALAGALALRSRPLMRAGLPPVKGESA